MIIFKSMTMDKITKNAGKSRERANSGTARMIVEVKDLKPIDAI